MDQCPVCGHIAAVRMCQWCAGLLTGRQRYYCSDACRQAAYRKRRADERYYREIGWLV